MHSAPAVSYPVGRSSFYATFLVAVYGLGAGVLLVWGLVSVALTLAHVTAAALWLLGATFAGWSWWRFPTGALTWDAQHWVWSEADEAKPVTLVVTLDLQHLMLIQLRSDKRHVQWVWLARRSAPARWLACRRAVFARQPAERTGDLDWAAP